MPKLDEEIAGKLQARRGLRKKFFLTVVLPPLVPLLILGVIGSFTLTRLVRNSIIAQLERSAATTAARADREFSIRETILKRTGEEIFAIKADFTGRRAKLLAQRDGCIQNIRAVITNLNSELTFIDNPNCAPFLYKIAELVKRRDYSSTQDYENAHVGKISDGYSELINGNPSKGIAGLNNEENEKISGRFQSFVLFFPETEEIAVIDNAEEPKVVASFLKEGAESAVTAKVRKKAIVENVSELQTKGSKRFVLNGIPIEQKGAALAAYDTGFLKPTLEATPKLYAEDSAKIIDSSGALALELIGSTGEKTVAKEAVIANNSWKVVTESPERLVLAPLRQAQFVSFGAILISLIVSLVVGFVFVTSATNSIKKLLTGALTFARGKLDYKIYLATGDELEVLANTMNDMAKKIQEAQAALLEKSKEFIYVATHELKAPMTAIIGYLSMIIDEGIGKVDTRAREFITEAYGSTVRLRELVSDLLDIARLEAGKSAFKIKPVDIADEVSSVLTMEKLAADTRQISLNYEAKEGLPKILADKEKLRVILTNFISNAIKYNRPGGSVTVGHRIARGYLETSVTDTGLGMPKSQQAQVFQKFFRVKTASTAEISGTGLGLYITKQFIETMGGRVWFSSAEGKGTTFTFALPLVK